MLFWYQAVLFLLSHFTSQVRGFLYEHQNILAKSFAFQSHIPKVVHRDFKRDIEDSDDMNRLMPDEAQLNFHSWFSPVAQNMSSNLTSKPLQANGSCTTESSGCASTDPAWSQFIQIAEAVSMHECSPFHPNSSAFRTTTLPCEGAPYCDPGVQLSMIDDCKPPTTESTTTPGCETTTQCKTSPKCETTVQTCETTTCKTIPICETTTACKTTTTCKTTPLCTTKKTCAPETTTCPPKTTTCPPKTTTCSPQTTTCPPKTTTCAPQTTTCAPKTTTSAPQTTTCAPKTTACQTTTPCSVTTNCAQRKSLVSKVHRMLSNFSQSNPKKPVRSSQNELRLVNSMILPVYQMYQLISDVSCEAPRAPEGNISGEIGRNESLKQNATQGTQSVSVNNQTIPKNVSLEHRIDTGSLTLVNYTAGGPNLSQGNFSNEASTDLQSRRKTELKSLIRIPLLKNQDIFTLGNLITNQSLDFLGNLINFKNENSKSADPVKRVERSNINSTSGKKSRSVMDDLIKFQLMHGVSSPGNQDLINAFKDVSLQAQKFNRDYHLETMNSHDPNFLYKDYHPRGSLEAEQNLRKMALPQLKQLSKRQIQKMKLNSKSQSGLQSLRSAFDSFQEEIVDLENYILSNIVKKSSSEVNN